MTRGSPRARDHTEPIRDRGAGLVGLIVSLAIVGALAAAVPLFTSGSKGAGSSGTPTVAVSTPGASAAHKGASAGSDISAAQAVACTTTYEAAETAVGVYQAETGALPTAVSQLEALIPDPLSSPSFSISIDPQRPGQLQVATPGHPAADGDLNCTASGT